MEEKKDLKPKFKGKAIVFCFVLMVAAVIVGYGISNISTDSKINKITGDFTKDIAEKNNQLIELKEERTIADINEKSNATSESIIKQIKSMEAENQRLLSVNSDLRYNNEVYRNLIKELSDRVDILRTSSHSGGGGYIPTSPSGY